MPFKSEKQRKWMHANEPEMAKKWEKEEEVKEAKKRDYKAEYKKFQSSPKMKKYRAELNAYNRKKGTYGNGDKKDASHRGGKIVGFENQSKNRGRAEKSRLKKEAMSRRIAGKTLKIPQPGDFGNDMGKYMDALNKHMKDVEKLSKIQKKKGVKETKVRQLIRKMVSEMLDEGFAGSLKKEDRKKFDNKRRKQAEVLGYKLAGKDDIRSDIGDATVQEGKLSESGIMYRAGVKKYGKEGMRKIQQAAGKRKGHEEIGKIKDKYDKTKKDEGKINEISNSEAKTLLKQLGGGRFLAMTGAKDFGIGKDGLHFKIGRNAKSISHVVINYNRGKDLYDMKFLRVRAGKIKVVKKVEDVYFDQLGEIFKRYTGMNVKL